MYELRLKETNELVGWCEYPDEVHVMWINSVYLRSEAYVAFNPKSTMK